MSARLFLALSCSLTLAAWGAEVSPELELTLQSLRPGERDRLFKAIGPVDEAPLYRADLEVDPEKRLVTGKVVITFVPRTGPASTLDLRVTPNANDKSRVKFSKATAAGKPTTLEQPEPTLFRVKLDPPAPKGLPVTVELSVNAMVPKAPANSDSLSQDPNANNAAGADHGTFMAAPEVVNLAGLIPGIPPSIDNRPAMGGPTGIGDLSLFEPANYVVTVVVPAGWAAVGCGTSLGEVPEKDGRVRFSYAIAAARDFGLFVTRGYTVQTSKLDGITVESHFLPEDKDAGGRALKYAANALADFQKRLGPYPWTTFRVVQTRLTAGAGGMEFPAMVAVSTGLYRGAADPLAALGLTGLEGLAILKGLLGELKPVMEQTLEFTVAHEVAHQWFPMMVGSDPIEEPVVDEALAQEMALLSLEWRHGVKTANDMREAQLKLAFQFHRMMGGADGPALRPTRNFNSVGEYAALVYGKAPLLYDNQRKLTGDASFLAGLKAYVDSFRWHWAGPKSLTGVLAHRQPKLAKPLEELRKRYWEESHGDEDIGSQGIMSALPPGMSGLLQGLTGGGAPSGQSSTQQLSEEQQKLLEETMKALQGQMQGEQGEEE